MARSEEDDRGYANKRKNDSAEHTGAKSLAFHEDADQISENRRQGHEQTGVSGLGPVQAEDKEKLIHGIRDESQPNDAAHIFAIDADTHTGQFQKERHCTGGDQESNSVERDRMNGVVNQLHHRDVESPDDDKSQHQQFEGVLFAVEHANTMNNVNYSIVSVCRPITFIRVT